MVWHRWTVSVWVSQTIAATCSNVESVKSDEYVGTARTAAMANILCTFICRPPHGYDTSIIEQERAACQYIGNSCNCENQNAWR